MADDWLSNDSYDYDYVPDDSGSYLNDIDDYYTLGTDYYPSDEIYYTGLGSGFDSDNWGNYPIPGIDTSSTPTYGDIDTGVGSGFNSANWGVPSSTTQQASGGFMDIVVNALDKAGNYLQTPGGQLMAQIGGGVVGALGAMYQNKLQKDAQKKYEKMLAERKAAAEKYSAPLHLTFDRTANASPEARNGESLFFSNNKLPSYYAEGGSATQDQPSVLGFIKYLMAGKKLPSEVQGQKEAERQRLLNTSEPSAEAGLVKMSNRKQAIDQATEGYCGGGPTNYVRGGTSGQSDKINAMLSDGEYVMDADVVSALGDGNNEAGAKVLDKMREKVRSHKRSAPANKIPPKAKSPLEYMKGKKEKK